MCAVWNRGHLEMQSAPMVIREAAFFGVIVIDTIGILSCAATCGITEKDWPEDMPKATANPPPFPRE